MMHDDMHDIKKLVTDTILINDDLQEVQTHDNLEFPVNVYDITLSRMQLHMIRWHWHIDFEMVYILEGKLEFLIDTETIILTSGRGILVNQNILHAIHSVEGHDAVFFSVLFQPPILFGYGSTTLSSMYLTPISGNPHMKYILLNDHDPATAPIISHMKNIHDYCIAKEFGYELTCKAELCNLWNVLLKLPQKDSTTVINSKRIVNDEQRIKDAMLYIVENFAEPITLDDIANSIHISKSECCRCFKRVLHLTPFEYLLKFRIFHAAKLIRQQDPEADSISNLATIVGFGNISYFNKVFKRYLHMTPTEYKHMQNMK